MNSIGHATEQLWERFVSTSDEIDLGSLRPFVRESWLRCKASRLDPATKRAPTVFDQNAIVRLRSESRVARAASPILDLTFDALRDLSGGLLLTVSDARGQILYHLVNPGAVSEVERINTISGACCNEETMGTDSLACCIKLERPVSISWYEHYLAVGHPWAGHAAPIKDLFTNRLVGVICLYSYQREGHAKAHELIGRCAELTERCLYAQGAAARLLVGESYEATRERYKIDPCLAITAEGHLLKASPEALRSLGISNGAIRTVSTLADLGLIAPDTELSRSTRRITLRDRSGAATEAALSPVVDGESIAGYVAVIDSVRGSVAHRSPWSARYVFGDIVGKSPEFLACVNQGQRLAETDDPVLLIGESGTGKELFAQSIHNNSSRHNRPFIPVNCGGLNDELLSAELFGYVEGAFTGATRRGRLGKFRAAHGGTLFLDEIEAMTPRMQSHLLRVLEDKRVFPVGSEEPFEADVRIIAATNMDLGEKMRAGSFRKDLFYRLSCHTVKLPALRHRKSDIEFLAAHFLAGSGTELDSDAVQRLQAYCWPGNVRELRNVLAQALQSNSEHIIRAADLPPFPLCDHDPSEHLAVLSGRAVGARTSLINAERDAIVRALRESGNLSLAAKLLGVSRATLYRKLKKHSIRADYS